MSRFWSTPSTLISPFPCALFLCCICAYRLHPQLFLSASGFSRTIFIRFLTFLTGLVRHRIKGATATASVCKFGIRRQLTFRLPHSVTTSEPRHRQNRKRGKV